EEMVLQSFRQNGFDTAGDHREERGGLGVRVGSRQGAAHLGGYSAPTTGPLASRGPDGPASA
ncbi:MAG TPA: hypothetical protein VE733_21110, partial [Streptosporangiaceae bacterium]|nr:hypothetical protein [Streptosporangiaceae bacterium]